MKNFYNIILSITIVVGLSSCKDDFLDKVPLDDLSEDAFFNTSTDLKTYVNGFYEEALRRYDYQGGTQGSLSAFLDLGSDVLINNASITSSLNRIGASGQSGVTSGTWNTQYDRIRSINYFLANYDRVDSRDVVANHYIGEGYFFRAWQYFELLKAFGGVPYIDRPLNVDDEELYAVRDSRNEMAKKIIADLDSAILNLSWKGVSAAATGRVNKETAIVMKARVALFEGTWERYHSQAGSPFAVSGEDGTVFLQMIAPAVQELIDHQGNNIFTSGGIFNEPYNQLFIQTNGESTAGVFFYRVYDATQLNNSHNFYDNITDIGASITDRLVNAYLDADGIPQELSARPMATLNEKGQNLDPRFRQTIWTPDRGPMTGLPGRAQQGDYDLRYPLVNNTVTNQFTSTGYRRWKGAVLDVTKYRLGEADDILVRYAEGLLAYAEAKAILGTINQSDLDQTVNVLRSRVGMTPMSLSAVNGWSVTYEAATGFDPTESNIVNEIRRERTVELALDGFRLDDLKRWALYDEAVNGYKPKGAMLQEFLDYFNDPTQLAADGWTGTDLTLTPGSNVNMDTDGFINPYFQFTQFQAGGTGFMIDGNRDYLQAIPSGEIDLYNQSNVTLKQNPGWF